jgi:hypothetical protein
MKLNVSIRNGREYMYIEKSYRDVNGKVKNKNILTLGYADKYKDEYDNPVAHFREVARKMTEDEEKERKLSITVNMEEELSGGSIGRTKAPTAHSR